MMYNSSELLHRVGGGVKAKVNDDRSKPLYKEVVTIINDGGQCRM